MLVRHILADLYRCDVAAFEPSAISDAVVRAVSNIGAALVGNHAMEYVPHGVTMTFFLAESHVLVSTWPEHRLMFIDVMLCNEEMDPMKVISDIKSALCPSGDIRLHSAQRIVGSSAEGKISA